MFTEYKRFSVDGFNLTDNTAVGYLEQALGISFPQKPLMIELTWRNRLVLARKANPIFALTFLRGREAGAYDGELNTFFADKGVPMVVALHENMHAYVKAKNPELRTLERTYKAINARITGKDAEYDDPETPIVHSCLNEGLCDWSAVIAATAFPEVGLNETKYWIASHAYRLKEKGHETETPQEYRHRNLDIIYEGVELFRTAIGRERFEAYRYAQKAQKTLYMMEYYAGYIFVLNAMSYFQASGIYINTGIDLLIQNPPLTVDQLRNGKTFARDLMVKNNLQ